MDGCEQGQVTLKLKARQIMIDHAQGRACFRPSSQGNWLAKMVGITRPPCLLCCINLPHVFYNLLHVFNWDRAWRTKGRKIERAKDERRMELEGRQTAWKKMKHGSINKSKHAVQMLLPLITALFTIGYWLYAFQIYNSESN